MPGFFDIIFRASKPEPKAPQPKKVKKTKTVKKTEKPKEDTNLVNSLRAEMTELREMILITEPEPEIVTEEPDDDESS